MVWSVISMIGWITSIEEAPGVSSDDSIILLMAFLYELLQHAAH